MMSSVGQLMVCLVLGSAASTEVFDTVSFAALRSNVHLAQRSSQRDDTKTLHARTTNQEEKDDLSLDEGIEAMLGDIQGMGRSGPPRDAGPNAAATRAPQAVAAATSQRSSVPVPPPQYVAVAINNGAPPAPHHVVAGSVKQQAHISIQAPHQPKTTAKVSAQPAHVSQVPKAAHVAKPVQAAKALPTALPSQVLAVAPPADPPLQVPEIAKVSPSEHMARHFAQVLRTAEVLPVGTVEVIPQRAVSKKYVKPVVPKTHFHSVAVDDAASQGASQLHSTVQSAAKEVTEQLSVAEAAQSKARILDRQAAEERANATVLARETTQKALDAGAEAAHKKANELVATIAKLEDQAERAQVRSAALHSKAQLETAEASELMAVADRSLNHFPGAAA